MRTVTPTFGKPKGLPRALACFLTFIITFGSVAAAGFSTPAEAAVTSTSTSCSAGTIDDSKIKVEPSHGSVFYIDTGVTPKVDAAYVGYKVTNTDTGADKTGLWVQVVSPTCR